MEIVPIKGKKKEKRTDFTLISVGVLFGIALVIIGVATAIKSIADWGAEHQFVKQKVVELSIKAPYRIDKIEPIKELVVLNTPYDELTTTEQKIIKVWQDYKTSMVAIAIFRCESGLMVDAVSRTGDLGIAQIHFPTWKDKIKEKFGYTAIDMFDVNKNLEVAYYIWDRADGTEGNEEGSFEPWTVYKNGTFISCLE